MSPGRTPLRYRSVSAPGAAVFTPPPLAGTGAVARGRTERVLRLRPTIPHGKTSAVKTNKAPRTKSQVSGAVPVSQVLVRLTRATPTTSPIEFRGRRLRPKSRFSIELPGENWLRLMIPTCGTYSAPAMPARTAETVKTKSFALVTE